MKNSVITVLNNSNYTHLIIDLRSDLKAMTKLGYKVVTIEYDAVVYKDQLLYSVMVVYRPTIWKRFYIWITKADKA